MRISIITPSYNQVNFLRRTLRSIESQTYVDYEHIVFDGGSSDGSQQLLTSYAKRDQRASFVSEADRGQAHAINKGLAAATGNILTWLNTDDYYEDRHTLCSVIEFFRTNPDTDVCYGRGLRVDADGVVLSEAFVQPPGSDFALNLQHSLGLLQPAVFFRRKVYEVLGGLSEAYDLQLDYEFWIRAALNGFRFGHLDRNLARATVHSHAKSTGQRQAQLNECMHLVKDKFGYVPIQWISRFAEFYVTGLDRKVVREIKLSNEQKEKKILGEDMLLDLYDNTDEAFAVLESNRDVSPYAETLVALRSVQERRRKRKQIVITSFDSTHFQQGLNLIASLHRTSLNSVDVIFVYSLGLSENEQQTLGALEKVEVVPYPKYCENIFSDYLEPTTRAYKPAAIRSSGLDFQDGDLVLWMDAGLCAFKSIQKIFDIIAEKEFFITDHDDMESWPFFNVSFAHPESHGALEISNSELLAPHLCSCVIGYRRGGKFQKLIDQAYEIGTRREAVVWPKILDSSQKKAVSAYEYDEVTRQNLISGKLAPEDFPRKRLLRLFPFYGHRTQTIYSMLAHRYDAPRFSAKRFHRSNKKSSRAAASNWRGKANEVTESASRQKLSKMDGNVVLYHHRGTYNNLDGMKFRRKGEHLFVLGNGPSLKGIDLSKLEAYATIGMNAAYRYWEKIGFYPTYYCCFDLVVLDSHKTEIAKLINMPSNNIQKFFLRKSILDAYPEFLHDPRVFFLEDLQKSNSFFDVDKITTGSFSVIAGLFLGYRNIYLLGIDLNYIEIISEARMRGTELHIDEQPTKNPNYFFDDYQRRGDRYNPPNRTPGLHERSWQEISEALDGFPAKIINLNSDSAVKAFPMGNLGEINKRITSTLSEPELLVEAEIQKWEEQRYWRRALVLDLARYSKSVKVSETKAIARMLKAQEQSSTRVLVDVGAHRGGSAAHFADDDWKIYCFEPDRINREKLVDRFASYPNVFVDSSAVGENKASAQPFFSSMESSGISTLAPFHNSHKHADFVKVTTISDVVEEHELTHIDFLKIDVEGLDFFVLKGVPWDTVSPEIIECEFDDTKTKRLSYSYKDMAEFLVGKGYTVFISEWHPIVRYGIEHQWCQLRRYPAPLNTPKAWGNLLAFKKDPGLAALRTALLGTARTSHRAARNQKAKKENVPRATAATRRKSEMLLRGESAGRLALAIRRRNRFAYRVGQFCNFALRRLWRYRWAYLAAFVSIALALAALHYLVDGSYRWIVLRSVAGVAALFLLAESLTAFIEVRLSRLLEATGQSSEIGLKNKLKGLKRSEANR